MVLGADPYNLAPDFERALIVLLCRNQKFYALVGDNIDSKLLSEGIPRLVTDAAQAIARETGKGPDQGLLVIQRLKRWMSDGKVSYDQITAANDYLDAAEDCGLPSEELVLNEIVPILRRRMEREAAQAAFQSYSERGDFSRVSSLIESAKRIGVSSNGIGTKFDLAAIDDLASMSAIERLPTGIGPLDTQLVGGLQRGGLGIFMGGPGHGKSIALAHVAAHAIRIGKNVLLVTLELSEQLQLARITANLTGIPIDAITGNVLREEAKKRISKMALGNLVVKYFTPQIATVEDIAAWTERCAEKIGPTELLVVDYGDRLAAPKARREYDAGMLVFEGLRNLAEVNNWWVWTASQSRRPRDAKRKLDMDDVADSMHKPRIADLFITLNSDDSGRTIEFFIGKHRTGVSRVSVGPLPTEFEIGRICPLFEQADAEIGVVI